MDDKLSIFWNLDVLVKMCRSKNDGPSLRIEEVEILEKIKSYKQEIEDINFQNEEESYDTSAEMADRNIEIITKKQLQVLKTTLKEKNKQLSEFKEKEESIYSSITLLKETKKAQEKYVTSMQDRVNETTDYEVVDRYNALIAETTEKLNNVSDEIEEKEAEHSSIQESIIEYAEKIKTIEEKISKKKILLDETKTNLENKENYIDQTKKEKNNRRIKELEEKIEKLNKRLEEIKVDPKYLESKIKDVINNKEPIEKAKKYLVTLINIVIRQPYINVPADNALEEELLKATQARDSFANEIDQKSYNILEAETPEKLRIDFLTHRIEKWQEELKELKFKVDLIDKDSEFNYEEKNHQLYNMIELMKNDIKEFQKAYDDTPDTSISYKASLKAQIDERKEDVIEAEKIATAFRKDESEDITKATKTMKYECELIEQNITRAKEEIQKIKDRLTTKKSGLIDITSKNKDKDTLKELAQIVIDIKHRRQFPETPIEIVHKLEESLGIEIENAIDRNIIDNNSSIEGKNYEEYTTSEQDSIPVEVKVTTDFTKDESPVKRGIKVINEATISTPLTLLNSDENESIEEESIIQTPLGFIYEEPNDDVTENNLEELVETTPLEQEENSDFVENDSSEEQEDNLEITSSTDDNIPVEETSESVIEESIAEVPVVDEVSEEIIEENNINNNEDNTPVEIDTELSTITDETSESSEEVISEKTEEEISNIEDKSIENIIPDEAALEEIRDNDDIIDKEIDEILGLSSTNEENNDFVNETETPEEEKALDIDEIINSTSSNDESKQTFDEDLSISSMFGNTTTIKNDKINMEVDSAESQNSQL